MPADRQAVFLQQVGGFIQQGAERHTSEILDLMRRAVNEGVFIKALLETAMQNGKAPQIRGAQSFCVHQDDEFLVRLNIWYPPDPRLIKTQDRINRYFSYDVMHNHNFALFTIGVLGSGYFTEIYRSRSDLNTPRVGDHIDLEFDRAMNLGEGVALYMKQDTEFHVQRQPKEYSVTLNVIPNSPRSLSERQFVVDHPDGKVIAVIEQSVQI